MASFILTAGAGAATVSATENLVANPGFEEPQGKDGLPGGGWWVFEGRGRVLADKDAKVAHSGAASVRLHSDEDSKGVLVSRKFEVAPGDQLRFEVWVRATGNTQQRGAPTVAGLAFRDTEAKVIARSYFESKPLNAEWSPIFGAAVAPSEATSAEIHLGYSNAPAAIWYDDVVCAITNPVSFSVVAPPKPWNGAQELKVRISNRQTNAYRGTLDYGVDQEVKHVPVVVAAGAARDLSVAIKVARVGAHNLTFILRDAGGHEISTTREKFRTAPPLDLYPACPCYLFTAAGTGETRIDARINRNPSDRAGLKFGVELLDEGGRRLDAVTNDVGRGDFVSADLRVPVEHVATFAVAACLLDPAGVPLGEERTDVRVTTNGCASVSVGPDGYLRIGGAPNFPIGLYSAGHYEEMARAGFTTTHQYSIVTGDAELPINPTDRRVKELLDQTWALGMRMMVELPRKAIEKAQWDQVRRRIQTFRHHPGLLCWGSEERVARGAAPLANIAMLYSLVKELDPDHPLVLGDTRDVIQHLQKDRRNFFPDNCMDIGIWWWYPFPLKEPDGNGLEGGGGTAGELQDPSWLTTTRSQKPLWVAIQSYQKPIKDAEFPTPAQYRCQAYLSLMYGAKGLFFYTGSGQRDYLGKPAGLLNKPIEGHWDYVQQLVHELRDFTPLFMDSQPATGSALQVPKGPFECRLREAKGKLLLLAANKGQNVATLRLRHGSFTGRQVRVLYEDRHPALEGDMLIDHFGAFGVHIYEFTLP